MTIRPISPMFLPLHNVFALAFLLVFIAGCQPSPVTKKSENEPVTRVKTVVATQTEVQRTTTQPATVHAFFRAEIRARANGYVTAVEAEIGDYVKAGATLASIDVPEMEKQRLIVEAKIMRHKAEEKRASAGVELAVARVESAAAKLAEAKSQVSRSDALLAAATAEFDRTEDLVTRGSLQDRMLDEARKKRDSETAAKQAMSSAVRSAQAEVVVAKAQESTAQADLEAARAETQIAIRQLEELDVILSYAKVKAPFAGVVTDRQVELGDLVRQAGGGDKDVPLFVVSQVDTVRVRIPLPENDAALVNVGDEVTLTFPSFSSEEPIVAKVTRTSGEMDPSTRTMLIESEIDNQDGKLIPGMFGQASVSFSNKLATTMLPSRAVRFSESGDAYVYAISEDQTVQVVAIETGLDDGKRIEVRNGINQGQQVIDAHLQRFTDGQKVAILQ